MFSDKILFLHTGCKSFTKHFFYPTAKYQEIIAQFSAFMELFPIAEIHLRHVLEIRIIQKCSLCFEVGGGGGNFYIFGKNHLSHCAQTHFASTDHVIDGTSQLRPVFYSVFRKCQV